MKKKYTFFITISVVISINYITELYAGPKIIPVKQTDSQLKLFRAAHEGDTEKVNQLITYDTIDLSLKDHNNQTAAIIALKSGHTTLFKYLVNAAQEQLKEQETEKIFLAAYNNDQKTIQMALKNKFNINCRYNGETLLIEAIKCNHMSMIELLLEHGADTDTQDYEGNSPLHHAVSNNSIDIVKLLIRYGANVSITNNENLTPLDYSDPFEKSFPTLLDELQKGAGDHTIIELSYGPGITATMLKAVSNDPLQLNNQLNKFIKLKNHKKNKTKIYHDSLDTKTIEDALIGTVMAIADDNFSMLIKRYNIDVNILIDKNRQPLIHAVIDELVCMYKQFFINLVSHSLEKKDFKLQHELAKLVKKIDSIKTMLELLFEKNVAINALSHHRMTPLHRIIEMVYFIKLAATNLETHESSQESITHIFMSFIKTYTPLSTIIQKFLTHGAYINPELPEAQDMIALLSDINKNFTNQLIYNTATSSTIDALDKLLIKISHNTIHNNCSNSRFNNTELPTLLHIAADTNNKELVDYVYTHTLYQDRATMSVNNFGKTAVDTAAQKNNTSIINAILKYERARRRNPQELSQIINSALICAACAGQFESVKLLCEHYNADPYTINQEDSTTLLDSAIRSSACTDQVILYLYNYMGNYGQKINGRNKFIAKAPYNILKFLCELSIDTNDYDTLNGDKNTLLHYAILNKRPVEIIKLLCKYNADIFQLNAQNQAPLDLAIQDGNPNILNFFLENYPDIDLLVLLKKAIRNQNLELKKLASQKIIVNYAHRELNSSHITKIREILVSLRDSDTFNNAPRLYTRLLQCIDYDNQLINQYESDKKKELEDNKKLRNFGKNHTIYFFTPPLENTVTIGVDNLATTDSIKDWFSQPSTMVKAERNDIRKKDKIQYVSDQKIVENHIFTQDIDGYLKYGYQEKVINKNNGQEEYQISLPGKIIYRDGTIEYGEYTYLITRHPLKRSFCVYHRLFNRQTKHSLEVKYHIQI